MKWPLVKLGDCGAIISGATPKTAISEYWDGAILWATPKDLSNLQGTYISDTANTITAEGFKSCSATMLPADSVLFSSRAPIGLLAINTQPMCTNQGFKSIVPIKEKINSKYLYYILKSKKRYLNSIGNGATFKELSKEVFSKVQIPLPPLDDQIRIATVLTRAEQLIAKRKDSMKALDALLKSRFLEMFGDPVRNEKGWEEIRWDKLFEMRTGKLNANAMSDNGKYPFFTCAKEIYKIDFYDFDCEALLLAGNNATADYDVKYYKGKFNAYQRTYVLELTNPAHSYRFYQYHLEYKLSQLKEGSKGANTRYLTKQMLDPILFIEPPTTLQSRFAAIVEKVEALKVKYQQSLAELENLYGSLSQRAFKGELDLSGVRV